MKIDKILREDRRIRGMCVKCGGAREDARYAQCQGCRVDAAVKRKGPKRTQACTRCGDSGHRRSNCDAMRAATGLPPVERPRRPGRDWCACGGEKAVQSEKCSRCHTALLNGAKWPLQFHARRAA